MEEKRIINNIGVRKNPYTSILGWGFIAFGCGLYIGDLMHYFRKEVAQYISLGFVCLGILLLLTPDQTIKALGRGIGTVVKLSIEKLFGKRNAPRKPKPKI